MNKLLVEVALSNGSCIFDSGVFETVKDAVEWSLGRGGSCVMQLSRGENFVSVSVSADGTMRTYAPGGWCNVTVDQLDKYYI